MHRHDCYAIGITLAGVQSFRFRGRQWHCVPGQCHILHPDEPHDGGTHMEAGLRPDACEMGGDAGLTMGSVRASIMRAGAAESDRRAMVVRSNQASQQLRAGAPSTIMSG
ncbi:AraC family ligand binding domain-containing protein [Bradyrhizobium sp.]|uniref:AraC family ligand binding domain-containing protein n=1 Tax=Bradyrhizobium sp. TaxID=376 RepID=UPI003C4DE961